MPEKRVTLQDIVEKTGYSRATVSLALRGLGTLSERTRDKIRETAENLGYRPDPLMSAFSRHRQKGVSPGSVIALIGIAEMMEWLEPAVPTAARLGYKLETFAWDSYPTQAGLVRVLEARGIAGAIFIEGKITPVPDLEHWTRLRCVHCGAFPTGDDAQSPFPIVRSNPFDSVTIAWRKAMEAGCRRIGLLLTTKQPRLDNIEIKMLASYTFHQHNAAADFPRLSPLAISIDQSRQQEGVHVAERWLREQQPDVVITGSNQGAELPRQCGYRIPEQLYVINLRQSNYRHDLAGLTLDRVAVINTAIHHLHSIIQHGNEMQTVHQPTIVLNPIWQDGESFPVFGNT